MRQLMMQQLRGAFPIVTALLCLLLWIAPAQGMTFDQLTVNFTQTSLVLNLETGAARLNIGSGENEFTGDWEIRKVSDRQFHIRRSGWKDFYWNIDLLQYLVQRVAGSTFGQSGGEAGVRGRTRFIFTTMDLSGQRIPPRLEVVFASASLTYDPKDGSIRFIGDGDELIDSKDMEVTFLKSGQRDLCQVRHRQWGDKFWEISLKEGKLWAAEGVAFGNADGRRQALMMGKVTILRPRNVAGIFEDLGFSEQNEIRRPRSEWIESRKARYRDILKRESYDLLLVPFQVQGYAVDRVGRSMMTRHLADRIARTTRLRVPDPTLVARALGEDARTFDEDELFKLANDLKVKLLIRGSVGHDRDEKMKLTLLIQEADGRAFTSATRTIRLDWQEIPFSDEHPPEDAFNDLLDGVMARVPVKGAGKPAPGVEIGRSAIALPANIESLTTGNPASPLLAAYYLQFLAMLYPEDTTAMEHLFERSLIVLKQVSPTSADYPLLKARALFYLHRRPAAMAALGEPRTPEERGFAAFLNGNLPPLKKAVAEMTSPLPKMMARIELIDLRWAYKERVSSDDYRQAVEGASGWEMFLARRLQSRDSWYYQSNIVVKQQLDALFPVPSFAIEDLLTSKIALGEEQLDDADTALSVHEHCRRYLDGNAKTVSQSYGNQYPTRSDGLDLFHDIGVTNLLQGLRIRVQQQGLPDEALEELGKYEKIYRGYPAMAYLKGLALEQQGRKKNELKYLLTQRDELYYQAYYWSGGQVNFAYSSNFPAYDTDYPQRPFWNGTKGDRAELKGDKLFDAIKAGWREKSPGESTSIFNYLKNIWIALKYTNDNFYPIKSGYEWLGRQLGQPEAANRMLELKQGRFEGQPDRIQFDVKLSSSVQDPAQRIRLIEDAITAAPDLWESYKELGDLYIRQGEFGKAREAFFRYPLFKQGEEGDRVKMSNEAFGAAASLWWRGGVDEAAPLFQIAAASDTGSGAEMMSAGILATTAGDFAGASTHFLRHIKRYKSSQGYREYLSLLHAADLHQESWSIFNTIDIQANSPDIWTAAFIGQRMEGKSAEQLSEWLTQDHFNGIDSMYLDNYLLACLLTDRPPDRTAPDLIRKTMNKLKAPPPEYTPSKFYRPNLAVFAEGFYLLRSKEYAKAYQVLEKWASSKGYVRADFAVPYLVFAAIKSENTAGLDDLFRKLDQAYGEATAATTSKAYYHLAKAYHYGLQGNHQEAMDELRCARFCLPFTGTHPLNPWYQLVETCEWLYTETGFTAYRDTAVAWAKIHQRIKPYLAWAYAVEVKYAASAGDRTKALAFALHLDPNSERISGLPDEERVKARNWLKQHRPFSLREDRPGPWIRKTAGSWSVNQS